jgi:hypothetical protein
MKVEVIMVYAVKENKKHPTNLNFVLPEIAFSGTVGLLNTMN